MGVEGLQDVLGHQGLVDTCIFVLMELLQVAGANVHHLDAFWGIFRRIKYLQTQSARCKGEKGWWPGWEETNNIAYCCVCENASSHVVGANLATSILFQS